MKEFESLIEIILINNFNYSDKEMYSKAQVKRTEHFD